MQLRSARDSDLPAIEALVQRAYGVYVERIGRAPAPMLVDYARTLRHAIVVVADVGDVVGVIVLLAKADHLLVENVAVHPGHQGRGIGTALLAYAETCARELGLSELRLYTNALMTENLIFYPQLGYLEVGRRNEDGFDRVYFCKRLSGVLPARDERPE
jgi:N-acetylglutamate synthase-like GNAT family acetyltransferase